MSPAVLLLAACLPPVLAKLGSSESARRLSQPLLTFYEPASDILQHSYIDLDQQEMEQHLAATPPDWDAARNIYTLGGNSGGRAEMTFSAAFTAGITSASTVTQQGVAAASGRVRSTAAAGTADLVVSYLSLCKQGGSSSPDVAGCFSMTGGDILVDGVSIGAPASINNRYRTLQGFSTQAGTKMIGQPTYTQYRAYYGDDDYANDRVLDALSNTGTCSTCDEIARVEFAKKTSSYMNVWMYVIHEMEDAITDCETGCITCNDDPVHAWDEALAFYSGSLEGRVGNSAGKLMYRLSEKRCANFGTCNDIQSANNELIIAEFTRGKTSILRGECIDAYPRKERIVELMSVPLVQGSLRYAWKVANPSVCRDGPGCSKERAEGAVFASAILPRIRTCNPDVAETIQQNMLYTASTPMGSGFAAVKTAFESVYACLGMTCTDVGGLLDGTAYYPGAEPCVDAASVQAGSDEEDSTGLVIAVILIAIIACGACIAALGCAFRARKYQQLLGENGGKTPSAYPAQTIGNSNADAPTAW